jgi:methanol--5-hydroxybenzimidazolylcobamide Co-methyltransferase
MNNELIFGKTAKPVTTKRGLVIGGGTVYPELNFTLPPMQVNDATFPEIKKIYNDIIKEAIERAIALYSPGVIFEFEALPDMTLNPKYGVEITKIIADLCEEAYQQKGFKSELRLTPNDIREYDRPPKMRTGHHLNSILELFDKGAQAGGDLLSIESTGGKEVCDEALITCDIEMVIFSLAVLGVRDMQFLWQKIVDIAKKTNKIAGGDTACGFANTAMVLADKKYIPKSFAAIVRVATVVRSLVAYEMGAVGPSKDCAYEGPFVKAITGVPISMEGKTAACAHLSPVGNISMACADLWSNESIQYVKLLGGMATTVSLEQLVYDVRLLNQSSEHSIDSASLLRDLLVASDLKYDPQALVLAPQNVLAISQEIIKGKNHLESTLLGISKALNLIEEAYKTGELIKDEKETKWLDIIKQGITSIPMQENEFIEKMLPRLDSGKIDIKEYGF